MIRAHQKSPARSARGAEEFQSLARLRLTPRCREVRGVVEALGGKAGRGWNNVNVREASILMGADADTGKRRVV